MANWTEIVQQYGRAAYGTAWRILGHAEDVEDVVQEVFIEAHRLHVSKGVENWPALLKRLATFRALDRLRTRKASLSLTGVAAFAPQPTPEENAIGRELEARLRTSIAELSEREAAVFCLRYFDRLSNQEISAALSITANAVRIALHKSRAKLERLLAEVIQEPKQ